MSSVDVDLNARSFRGTSSVVSGDEPTDPQSLTDEQASKGVQFFFVASQGFVDATFTVVSSAPDCTGRSLLFAGDAALCAPPPGSCLGITLSYRTMSPIRSGQPYYRVCTVAVCRASPGY